MDVRKCRLVSYFAVIGFIFCFDAMAARDWKWNPEPMSVRAARVGHSVRLESLSFGEIPVIGVRRKFYRGTQVGKALPLEKFTVDETAWREDDRVARLSELQARPAARESKIQWDLKAAILYSSKKASMTPVWEATPRSSTVQFLFTDILEVGTGKLIWRRPTYRRINARVYSTSPYNDGTNDKVPDNPALPSLSGGATTLASSYITVRRQQPNAGAGFEEIDVDPNTNFFSGATTDFDEDPANFTSTCRGTSAECANQGLDAVNVFYHVESYRSHLDATLTAIGEAPEFADPVMVLVNAIGFDVDGDGQTADEINNAFYSPCTVGTFTGGCLLFNPPASANYASCGVGSVAYYDLAREATVAVHEYQHYITDLITGLVQDDSGYNVGDVLHEGYSDYFAVTQVKRLSGIDASTILQYGFQNCPSIQRAIGTPKVFDASSTRQDPHYYGWTWASGLYELNQTLGTAVTEKIALKSLFYLPTEPSFIDAVEALVQADQSLNAGANALAIRTLFYTDLHFVGGTAGPYSDLSRGLVSVGVTSCLSVPFSNSASGPLTLGVVFAWLTSLLIAGRRLSRRQSIDDNGDRS